MIGYVISLERRPERLQGFMKQSPILEKAIQLQVHKAVDGSTIELSEELRQRVNPWNFANLNERTLRGVIGCALSHLQIWDIVKDGDEPFAIIFEDDARLLSTRPSSLITALREIPIDADLIWLSNYRRPALSRFKRCLNQALLLQPKVNFSFARWAAVTEVTTEAYVISRDFAKVASDFLRDDIGAVDEALRAKVANCPGNAFFLEPPLFRQADRSNSDIQT